MTGPASSPGGSAGLLPWGCASRSGIAYRGTGSTKLQNLPAITPNFAAAGIPASEMLAPFVSGVEFVGDIPLLVGLLTRFAGVPLMVIMVVAIIPTKAEASICSGRCSASRKSRFSRCSPGWRSAVRDRCRSITSF